MKILVCGKGGSGKSTFCALLAHAMHKRGYQVLLVDADESNFGLHRMAGLPMPTDIMENLGGKKGFKEKMNQTFPTREKPFQREITMAELPGDCVVEADGIRLASIGKIHHFGEGCACAMGLLSKLVLSKLKLGEKELVIVDTEAGIEHFGRRVDAECDLIFGIVDPTYESFMMSRKLAQMAANAGVDHFFVLNKLDDKVAAAMRRNIDSEKVVGAIPYNESIFLESLAGNPLRESLEELDPICSFIETRNIAC